MEIKHDKDIKDDNDRETGVRTMDMGSNHETRVILLRIRFLAAKIGCLVIKL